MVRNIRLFLSSERVTHNFRLEFLTPAPLIFRTPVSWNNPGYLDIKFCRIFIRNLGKSGLKFTGFFRNEFHAFFWYFVIFLLSKFRKPGSNSDQIPRLRAAGRIHWINRNTYCFLPLYIWILNLWDCQSLYNIYCTVMYY